MLEQVYARYSNAAMKIHNLQVTCDSARSMIINTVGNAQCLIPHNCIPERCTVKKERYVKIPHHLRDAVRKKHPEKWE
jgi:hypothetical protein